MGRRLKWGNEEDKQTELLQWGPSKCSSWAPKNPAQKQVDGDGDWAVEETVCIFLKLNNKKKFTRIVTKKTHTYKYVRLPCFGLALCQFRVVAFIHSC